MLLIAALWIIFSPQVFGNRQTLGLWGNRNSHRLSVAHTRLSFRTRHRAGFALAVLFTILFSLSSSAAEQRRIALVIGNSTYRNVPRLSNPTNDAHLIAVTLQRLGFKLVGNGAKIDLDKQQFSDAVKAFGQEIAGADVALFYYAGHGLQVDGVNWLVPVDANPTRRQDLDFQMVDAALVLRQMDGAGTHLNVMILDACRNDPFGGRGLRGIERGLAEMRVPDATIVSYATQPGNVAQDGSGPDSPFAQALADGMGHSEWEIRDVFNETGLTVKRETAGEQVPWTSFSPINGKFFLAGIEKPLSAPPIQINPISPGTLNVWSTASSSNSYHEPVVQVAFHRDFPELRLAYRAVAPDQFISEWTSATGNAAPDVAFIDNYTQLRPLLESGVVWQDWGFDRFGLNGWWVISKLSTHVEAARAFIRWLAAPKSPELPRVRNANLGVSDVQSIQAIARSAVGALQSQDREQLEALLDPDAAQALDDVTYAGVTIESINPI